MKNKPIDLYNNLTYENGFTVLFLGSDTRYSEAMQYVYNMHWNSVVTTFSLEANKIGIAAARFDAIENYRKVNPIGIADVEKRKNLFNKKKLIAFSCESCLEEPRYRPVFNKYLYDLCNKLGFGGTLILDGITVDEYEKLGINQYIWDLQKGNVFFFRCSDALRSRILSDLKVEEAETFSFFSDGVEEYLEEYLEDDSEYAYDEDNPDDVIYYFSGGKRRSFEKRKLIDTSGLIKLISTEDIDGKKVAHFLAEQYFYAFIKDSKNAPQWYAYENELTIKRDIDENLLSRVRSWLNNPGAINREKKERRQRILCVSGQSCSGKSVTIAKTAFEIFKEHEFPVVFIDRLADFSYTSERDPETQQTYTKNDNLRMLCDLLDSLKDNGAKSVLLVWDLSAYYNDMKKYVDLANSLESRNINFTLLCSSYTLKKEFLEKFKQVSCMPLPVLLSEAELADADRVLRKKANRPKDQIEQIMKVINAPGSQSNLLELIYFMFSGARDSMALGIKTEAWIIARDLFNMLIEDRKSLGNADLVKEYERRIIKTSVELAFEKAEKQSKEKKIERNNINRLIELVAFCTKLNHSVPILLALECCELDVSEIGLLSDLNLIDCVSNDSSDLRLFIRSRIEADILLGDSSADIKRIVDLIGDLIETISPYSNENVLLLRDILIDIGPNSEDKDIREQFSPYLETILEYLEEFRENGGDPRITLQEITIIREYYGKLFSRGEIDGEEYKAALTRSIAIGEKTADDKTIDRSLKYKIFGEVAQQKMLALDPYSEVSFDGLLMDLSPEELRNIMDNMSEAIQYEPDNSYYYVDWMKAALLLLSHRNISKDEKHEIMQSVLFIDSNLNEEHTGVKENEYYPKIYARVRDLIDGEGENYLKEQIAKGVSAAGYVLAFEMMGETLSKKVFSTCDEDRLTPEEAKIFDKICDDCLIRFAERDKKCFKLLLRIKKCVFNGGSWQNYQYHNYHDDNDKNAGITAISRERWSKLYSLCKQYYESFVDRNPYIRDSYNEIYLLALASAQVNLYSANNTESLFAEATRLLGEIRSDWNIKERQIEGRMDSRQFLCDEQGRIVLFAGQTTKKELTHLPVKLDGKSKTVFANINDLKLKNDEIGEGARSYFAISFGYMGLKAHRFDNKATVRYGDLGRVE